MTDSSALSVFLTDRGLNPADFQSRLRHFNGGTEWRLRDGRLSCTTTLMDIKRFDDLTAFLTSSVYLSGWPGIRRSTTTAIYRDGEEVPSFICEDVYVDGGHGTRGNDCFDRAFTDILGIRFEGERVAVRVKGVHSEHEIFCVPPSK